MMLEELLTIKEDVKKCKSSTLLYMFDEYLKKIKDLLIISKIILLEIDIRKEV